MGPTEYFILCYNSMRILGPMDSKAVCVTARVLMQLYEIPSFDIMVKDSKAVVTSHFEQKEGGIWFHNPQQVVMDFPR